MKAAKLRRRRFRQRHRDYYEGYFNVAHLLRCESDSPLQLRRAEVASALEGLTDGALVADFGCGVGDIVGAVPPRLRRIELDYSLQSLRLARRAHPGLPLANASLYQLPLPDSSIDAGICLGVLEHLEDDADAVREIVRVLRPGGLLVVSVPWTHYFHEYLQLTGHYRHYTSRSLEELLRSAGLEPVRALSQYPRFNAVSSYVYGALVALYLASNLLLPDSKTLYDRRLPLVRKPFYRALSSLMLKPVAERERRWVPTDGRGGLN